MVFDELISTRWLIPANENDVREPQPQPRRCRAPGPTPTLPCPWPNPDAAVPGGRRSGGSSQPAGYPLRLIIDDSAPVAASGQH